MLYVGILMVLVPQVNHAVCSCTNARGENYAFSFGGYHADDDERTVNQADTLGGPFFKSTPIDVHCLHYGEGEGEGG